MPRRARPAAGKSVPLAGFHPLVRAWFEETLGEPSAPQREGWPAIAGGNHTLILAPTGTGKTLAAFLWELNRLIVDGAAAPLPNAVQILYVSPLKALNNDVQRNLERPLSDLHDRFEAAGERFPEIRVAVRTGDTPQSARARMIRKSPHILITTPESLHIMLTTTRGRGMFSGVRAVIVDEIHAIAGSKRGAHLALTLERLDRLCDDAPQRVGLSATQRPLDEVARFLAGQDVRADSDPLPRPCTIVDCGLVKRVELAVESPVEDLAHVGGTIWTSVTPLVLRHMRDARTTLIFVNNRAQAEKMAARVNGLAGEEVALPYHGSLSRERRLILEQSLKAGKLRALVSTSALELGIDIGSVDLVIQLQSPKRVANGLQRVGRAGHSLDATSRGVLVPTFRDDALEMLAIVRAMRAGDVEPTRVVQNALDVLAQVIVAAVAIDDDWTSASLFDLVRRAYPYHALTRAAFDEVLAMLSGKYPADVAAELDARLTWDRVGDTLTAARSSRMVAVVSGGTIPDRGLYTVNLPDRTRLGELDEEFVHETRVGDVFQLGSSTWRVNAIEHDRVIVTPAPGAPARMPFWHGEYSARSSHLAASIGALRRELDDARTNEAIDALAARYDCDRPTAQSLVEYVHEQRAATGSVPDERSLVVEQFRDETNAVRVVIHAPFGGRVNAPWGMALAHRAREIMGPRMMVQVQTSDDGVMLRFPDLRDWVPLSIVRDLSAGEAERRVLDDVGTSSLFGARFRVNAGRALLLPRGTPRKRMPLWLQRLKARDLLDAVREYPSFPILVETYRDVLQDAFDMPALSRMLDDVASGAIGMRSVQTELPSPFASYLQFGFVMDWMYAYDPPQAEQRAAMLSLDRALLDELLGTEGADAETLVVLDEMLERRRGTARGSRARTADELAILLDRAGDLSLEELATRVAAEHEGRIGDPLGELRERARIVALDIPAADGRSDRRFVLAETSARYAAAFGEPSPARAAARREMLLRSISLAGPASVADILARYDFDPDWVRERFDDWTRAGRLVRGHFGRDVTTDRWCSRRLLEQARRRELARARKQIQAVDLDRFSRFMLRWQRVAPAARTDDDGSARAIRQLYGLARPAELWERELFPARMESYDPALPARLLAAGETVWVGGSSASGADEPPNLSSIRFLRRGTGRAWLPEHSPPLGEAATTTLGALNRLGAVFFDELVSETSLSPRKLRDALRELVGAGLVTNDTMDAMRAVVRWRPLVSPRGRVQPDPTRWLPSDFTPSANRRVVQRRPNARRLPRWRRPDLPGGDPETWPGRWSLVASSRILGPASDEATLAESVARQWLDRYGIVAREMWRRERPSVGWRAIYHELKRLEYRGEVRRGYFVQGLSGAQFALPEAVEELRSLPEDEEPTIIAAADPANVFAFPLAGGAARDPFVRPRGTGTLLVSIGGRVVMMAERRGSRVTVRPDADEASITHAAKSLVRHLARRIRRDLVLETIDGEPATTSRHAAPFVAAGFRRGASGLRLLRPTR